MWTQIRSSQQLCFMNWRRVLHSHWSRLEFIALPMDWQKPYRLFSVKPPASQDTTAIQRFQTYARLLILNWGTIAMRIDVVESSLLTPCWSIIKYGIHANQGLLQTPLLPRQISSSANRHLRSSSITNQWAWSCLCYLFALRNCSFRLPRHQP
jgi:hypothetical protein